jgi:hypothetical protein
MSSNKAHIWKTSPIDLGNGPLILLFYDGYERRARRSLYGRNASDFRRAARFTLRLLLGKQLRTGFYTQFLGLVTSLRNNGCDVRINNYVLADQYPAYPIGVAGYPSVLPVTPKGHPVLLGPGDFGMPDHFLKLNLDLKNPTLICFCEWIARIYEPYNPGRIKRWFAGIDTDKWHPGARSERPIDCLIYDKIRWNRQRIMPAVYNRIRDHLNEIGLSHYTLHYGDHTSAHYKSCLRKSKSLIFLCEHETQGLAYQEAMSMNVPIFAWDEGVLCDEDLQKFKFGDLPISSVPYFSEECGVTFREENVIENFNLFWNNVTSFQPRNYIIANLNQKKSADLYLSAYFNL